MSTVLVIESAMAGLVIGRGGCRIKSVQQDSGATVKLSDGDSVDTRKVIITGSEDARRSASSMVEKIISKTLLSSEAMATAPPNGGQKNNYSLSKKSPQSRKPFKAQRCTREPSLERTNISEECWAEIMRENEERDRKQKESLPPIKKDFYVEHDEVKIMSPEDVIAFRLRSNNIMVGYVDKDANFSWPIPKPVVTFQHAFHAYPKVLKVIEKQMFTEPSPVQSQAWPIILSGHDLIAIAQTGTGKTLAYILPAIVHLLGQPTPFKNRIGPSVLILGPTRELVQQIDHEIKKYVFNDIGVMCVYGGVPVEKQSKRLIDERPEIIVATPGRLNELIGIKAVALDHASYVVLDEADRMLNMGFKNQIELSLRNVRSDKQTILVSATWPVDVQNLANHFTSNPLHITVGSFDLATVNTVEQKVIVLKENEKEAWLEDFMNNKISSSDKVIIFMRKKVFVDKLFKKMNTQNIECRCIHGDRDQLEREASLADMRNGIVPILIATDVASRGLDIHDLTLVINYDFPLDIEEYVHRVGRTGRAGKTGSAITLFSHKDAPNASALINILEKSKQSIPKELLKMANN